MQTEAIQLFQTSDLLDIISLDIVLFDLDHRFLYVNKNCVPDDEVRNWLIGKDDFDYCRAYNKPIERAQIRRSKFNECVSSKKSVKFNETYSTPKGKKYTVRTNTPVLDEFGNVKFVIGYGYDNTDYEASVLQLASIKTALDTSKDGIAILNQAGEYTYMNSAHATIFGYEGPWELIGKTWQVIYDAAEQERIGNEVFPILGAQGFWKGDSKGISKHGEYVYQEISLTTLPDGGLICVTRDVTELRRLLARANQLSIVAENTNALIIIIDKDGIVDWANNSFYEKTGHCAAEFKGRLLEDFYYPDPNSTPIDVINESLTKGTFQGKICVRQKNNHPFWLLANVTAVYDANGNIINHVILQLDFNELQETEAKLYDSIVKEKNLNQIKSKFLNVTSHEIRTPLSNIELYAELIRVKQMATPAGQNLLDKISLQIKSITQILDDFLILSQAGGVDIKSSVEHVDLVEFVKTFLQHGEFNDGNQRISLNQVGESPKLMLDKTLMKMVLKNLVENALKYSLKKTPVDIVITNEESYVVLSITDYGIGIPDSEKDKLFQSFYRASNAEFIKGTGIGLTIVKEFVELQGGKVSFISEENKYTTFFIQFPK